MQNNPMNTEGPVISFNKCGVLIRYNQDFLTAFGYTTDEILGCKIQEKLLAPPYKTAFTTLLSNYLTSSKKYHIFDCVNKAGISFSAGFSGWEISTENSEFLVTVRLAILNATLCSLTFDLNGSIIAATNPDIFEYSIAEIVRQKLNTLFPYLVPQQHEGESKPSYKYLKSAFNQDKSKIVRGITKSGRNLSLLMEVDVVSVGEFIIFRASLQKEELEDMEGVLTVDAGGLILQTNRSVLPLFGYNPHELLGLKIGALLPDLHSPQLPPDSSNNSPNTSPTKRQKTSDKEWLPNNTHCSAHMRHKNGETIPVNWKIYELQGEEHEKHLVWLNRDFLPPLHAVSKAKPKQIGQYIIENTIGIGAFGKVKRAVHTVTNNEVAVKILNKQVMESLDIERSKREGMILQQLNHPNIVKFLESEETDTHLYFFLELVGGTDLKTHVLQRNPSIGELRSIFKQIASAIRFCHQLNIIHRDLKQTNILVDSNRRIKLIDFGLSNFSEEGKLRSTFCGSPAYAAPEMLLGTKYVGPEVDIWSLGVVLYAMVTTKLPFESVGQLIKCHYVIPEGMDEELSGLIKSMLESDPSKRATITDVVSHPWLNKCDFICIDAN